MHTNVILTNKRHTPAQSNYTNTKLKAWFRRLLQHPARNRSGSILHRYTPGRTREVTHSPAYIHTLLAVDFPTASALATE